MPRSIRAIGTFAALGLAYAAAVAADDYAIKLHRPGRPGDIVRESIRGSGRIRERVSTQGKTLKESTSSWKVTMVLDVKTLAVDKLGRTTREQITVRAIKGTYDGKPIQPLPAGSIVTAAQKGTETVFELKGGSLPKEISVPLDILAGPTKDTEGITDDDILGTTQRMKVGGVWKFDLKKAARSLSRRGLVVNADDMTGEGKLVAVRKVKGAPCLQVDMHFGTSKLSVPTEGGANVVEGVLKAQFSGLYPVDASLPKAAESMEFSAVIKIEIPAQGDQPTMLYERSTSLSGEISRSVLPAKPAVRK